MTEPEFWPDGDDAPPELQELLSFAEPLRPFDGVARQRSRRRVLALAAVPAAAGVMFWVQNFALGAVLGGTVSVGVAASKGVFSTTRSPEPAASSTVRPQPVEANRTKVTRAPLAIEEPRTENPRPPAVRSATSAPAAPSESSDGVAAEALLLEAARSALATEPARALALVSQHERDYPGGVLGVEREFLAIDALVRSGRRPEAEARAERLRLRVPGSLYEERVRRILGKGEQ
jgi:hypothetical protein